MVHKLYGVGLDLRVSDHSPGPIRIAMLPAARISTTEMHTPSRSITGKPHTNRRVYYCRIDQTNLREVRPFPAVHASRSFTGNPHTHMRRRVDCRIDRPRLGQSISPIQSQKRYSFQRCHFWESARYSMDAHWSKPFACALSNPL